jgi:hypothetical protein
MMQIIIYIYIYIYIMLACKPGDRIDTKQQQQLKLAMSVFERDFTTKEYTTLIRTTESWPVEVEGPGGTDDLWRLLEVGGRSNAPRRRLRVVEELQERWRAPGLEASAAARQEENLARALQEEEVWNREDRLLASYQNKTAAARKRTALAVRRHLARPSVVRARATWWTRENMARAHQEASVWVERGEAERIRALQLLTPPVRMAEVFVPAATAEIAKGSHFPSFVEGF